jgi:hypothetical protein
MLGRWLRWPLSFRSTAAATLLLAPANRHWQPSAGKRQVLLSLRLTHEFAGFQAVLKEFL